MNRNCFNPYAGREQTVVEHLGLDPGNAQWESKWGPMEQAREPWAGDASPGLARFVQPRLAKDGLDRPLRSRGRFAPVEAGIVANSRAMRQFLDLARRMARVDSTVLITGESGVGKERVARMIHQQSSRTAGPFVPVNAGAIPETLLESELFGHARGAFTGATEHRAGLFEAADHGTFLLDEIGDISSAMQVKLLRAIQEREIRRAGENRARPVDVRIIAATNRDLAQDVASGRFRQDLYYRLRVVELHVPALRDRQDDILPLARALLEAAAARMRREVAELSPRVADQLLRYPWPGNVRELENTMERAAALALGSRVEYEDLPEEIRGGSFPARPDGQASGVRPLEEMEKDYILEILARNDGNQARTARQLKIGTATLFRKLRQYGLTKDLRN